MVILHSWNLTTFSSKTSFLL